MFFVKQDLGQINHRTRGSILDVFHQPRTDSHVLFLEAECIWMLLVLHHWLERRLKDTGHCPVSLPQLHSLAVNSSVTCSILFSSIMATHQCTYEQIRACGWFSWKVPCWTLFRENNCFVVHHSPGLPAFNQQRSNCQPFPEVHKYSCPKTKDCPH